MKFIKNYSIMLIKSTAMIMLLAFSFSSCKKDKDNVIPPPSPVIGKWSAILSTSGIPIAQPILVIKSAGSLEVENINGQKTADGTWQLGGSDGITFSCSYTTNSATPQTYNLIGTLESPIKMTGAWGMGSSSVNGGFWNMGKQP